MCGIVGYLGQKKASDVILSGLHKLEYRGYDSCGITFYSEKKDTFITHKDQGRVRHLEDDFDYNHDNHLAIGHTRWATHGEPTQLNSHPHRSADGRFIIVHNGVIENYHEIKVKYLDNVTFTSETDTEVIVNLIEHFSKSLQISEAIRKTLSILEGSYALLILDTEHTNRLYAAKNKSPLLLGVAENGMTMASDVMALVGHADHYIPLEDKTYTEITATNDGFVYDMVDVIGKPIQTKMIKMDLVTEEIGKAGYAHYMLKEICEQPSVVRKIMNRYSKNGVFHIDENIIQALSSASNIHIIAAGTSMHAGLIAKHYFEVLAEIPTQVHIASEFAYNMPLLGEAPFFILISQSGETADLRACLVNLKEAHHPMLTVTNVGTSTLAREADYSLEIFAGPEIAVASTKAYVGQVTVLLILTFLLSDKKMFDLNAELSKAAVSMEAIIDNRDYVRQLVKDRIIKTSCFYIGRGIDYYTCMEAALKLKEISYIQTEGFAAGELKHGTIALIEKDIPVVAIITQEHISKNTRSNLQEVITRGAKTITISMKHVSNMKDDIVLMDTHELLTPLVSVIPTQLIAYYSALNLGRDIDKPRNLAKSVTVE